MRNGFLLAIQYSSEGSMSAVSCLRKELKQGQETQGFLVMWYEAGVRGVVELLGVWEWTSLVHKETLDLSPSHQVKRKW